MAIGTGTALLISAGVSAATSAYGAKKSSDASKKAATEQTRAIDKGADLISQEWERSRAMYDPYVQVGGNANMLMGQLMSPGGRTPMPGPGPGPNPGPSSPQQPPVQKRGPMPAAVEAGSMVGAPPNPDSMGAMFAPRSMQGQAMPRRRPTAPPMPTSGYANPGPQTMSPFSPYRGQMGSVTATRL